MIRRILISLALAALIAVPAFVSAQTSFAPGPTQAQLQPMLTRALADLELLEDWIDVRCAASDCTLERNRVDRVRATLLALHPQLVAPVYGAPVYGVPVEPMSDTQFRELTKRLNDEIYSSGKMELVKHQARYSLFTAKQVRAVMDGFFYSSSKLEALEALAPRMVDPDQALVIYDAFFYTHSKAKAREIIEEAFPVGAIGLGLWY